MTINEMAKKIHKNAVDHGFWEKEISLKEEVVLCHAELSEAIEADRIKAPMIYFEKGKPEGIAVELIDCVIRIFDYLEANNINIEETLAMKHAYNLTREYKHGKAY